MLLVCLRAPGGGALPLVHPAATSSQWLDLSHPLDHTSRHFPGLLDFSLTTAFNGTTKAGIW